MLERLKNLEEIISKVRKTQVPTWIHGIETPEEISLIRQAKREHHPIFATLSEEALKGLNKIFFIKAIQDGIIDHTPIKSEQSCSHLKG